MRFRSNNSAKGNTAMNVSSGMLTVSAVLLASLTGVPVKAAEIWSGETVIRHVYPEAGGMNFMTTYSNLSLSNCDNGARWTIAATTPNYQAMVATLLVAFATEKAVNLNITVNPVQCAGIVNRFIVKA